MQARLAYPLFLLPLVVEVSAFVAVAVLAGGAGVFWLFIYGDNPWPEAAMTALEIVAGAAFVLCATLLTWAAYRFGRAQQANGGVDRRHVILALGAAFVLPVLLWLRQV